MLKFIPVATVSLAFVTIITSYIVAASLGHQPWILPMISFCGNAVPESSIFSLGLTSSAFLMSIMVTARYLQVKQQLNSPQLFASKRHNYFVRLNKAGLILGLMSSVALSFVACFQSANVPKVHNVAAGIFFGTATILCYVMIHLSIFVYGWESHRCMHIFRLICAILGTIALVVGVTFKILEKYYKGELTKTFGTWAAANEWLVVFCFFGVWLFLYYDLSLVRDVKLLLLHDSEKWNHVQNSLEPDYYMTH